MEDRLDAELERLTLAEAAREVIERVMSKLGDMTEDDADAWSRAVVQEHWSDARDHGASVYESLVAFARKARELKDDER